MLMSLCIFRLRLCILLRKTKGIWSHRLGLLIKTLLETYWKVFKPCSLWMTVNQSSGFCQFCEPGRAGIIFCLPYLWFCMEGNLHTLVNELYQELFPSADAKMHRPPSIQILKPHVWISLHYIAKSKALWY